ncbi:hypothetical protein HOLleu_07185 [Holothuria leucospilota]|uniref:Uncharacterized protein n=1 Tax=Holothuria leucospilota TaxID=206669 RepID=A0A9Q1CGB0_HOLLE|nr:hypothetical protein HOLleu_07185 [Holothuria leucospilota]
MSNMKIIVVMLMVMPSFFYRVKAACCSKVESVDIECSDAQNISIAAQRVMINSMDARIKLPGAQKSIDWFCGSTKNTIISPSTEVNQIRVNYNSNGIVHFMLFFCDEIPGPFEAGLKCALQEKAWACPSTANDVCVYELKTETTDVRSTTTVNSVTTEVAAGVRASAVEVTGTTGFGVETTVSGSKIVTTSEGLFLEILPGTSFCAYTEGISEVDVHTPSGFTWRCSLTKFKEIPITLGGGSISCSDLDRCNDGVCDVNVKSGDACGSSSRPVSSFLTWAAMVLLMRCLRTFNLGMGVFAGVV